MSEDGENHVKVTAVPPVTPLPEQPEVTEVTEVSAQQPTTPSEKDKKRKVKFVPSWLLDEQFKDWLLYDSKENAMKCHFCITAKVDGVWATTGTDNFR